MSIDVEAREIELSGLFSASWYFASYPDVAKAGIDPVLHYLQHGASEGRDPGPGFSTRTYLLRYPDVAAAGINPLVHYIRYGKKEGRHPGPNESADQKSEAALVGESELFDVRWYLSEYKDVADAGVEPTVHYLQFGAREGRDPSPNFSSTWYLAQNDDVRRAWMNPLVHYLRYGREEGRQPLPPETRLQTWWSQLVPGLDARSLEERKTFRHPNDVPEALVRMSRNPLPPAIIVPVYNAPAEVQDCLQALLLHTAGDACRIIVINDASPNPAVRELLTAYDGVVPVEIVHNEKNLGFTRTVNRGIALAGEADVIFLNADTKVTPGWLRNLRLAVYSQERVGTATPFSNNAGAFSAPEAGKENPPPARVSLDTYARAITQSALRAYPSVPTGNGFCLYVRRDCLRETGLLDAEAFPRGYGEENDFCMRAGRLGWGHVIDDATLIYHVRSASFGEEKNDLMRKGRLVVDARYPDYAEAIKTFTTDDRLKQARARVRVAAAAITSEPAMVKPRVLYVISTRTGGTPQTNQDLMTALSDRIEAFVLHCNASKITLMHFQNGAYVDIAMHVLSEPIKAFPHRSDEYDAVVANWIVRYAIELVHLRHIAWHGLGLIDISKGLGLPVVFSFHDFYTVCPTVKLLDGEYHFCGGTCTTGDSECEHELWTDPDFPPLRNKAILEWKQSFARSLKKCDLFITTSESARQILEKNYPFLKERPFCVIPHGRDFYNFEQHAPQMKKNEPIRIVVPGNIFKAKGAEIVAELGRIAAEANIDIHVLGNVAKEIAGTRGVIFHGAYERDEFSTFLGRIRPHVGGIFSIWPETYCHTLTELWACGIPVIGFDFGAVGDRIRECGGGWLTSEPSAQGVIQLLEHLRADPAQYREKILAVQKWQTKTAPIETCSGMADAYYGQYKELTAL